MPTGTLIRNNQCQVATVSASDAAVGPAAKASATMTEFRPTPRPSSFFPDK